MGSREALHDGEYRRFVARLRQAREDAGLTQEAVAKLLGKSQRFVSRCEVGERRVDAVEFRDFCRAFKLPPSYFLSRWPEE